MKTNPAFAHAAAWRGDSSSDAELAGGSPVHSVDVGAETLSEYGPDDGSTMTEIDASGKTPPPPNCASRIDSERQRRTRSVNLSAHIFENK